jgi:SpoVK/Ycf46/Vps4 family AAA+-type ATPase
MTDYKLLKKTDLVNLCKQKGVRNISNKTKDELISILNSFQNTKYSIVSAISLLKSCEERLDEAIKMKNYEKVKVETEQLQHFLDNYSFEAMNHLEGDIKIKIASVKHFVAPKKKKVTVKDYESLDVQCQIKTGSKDSKPVVTVSKLKEELNSPDFISKFTGTIQTLMTKKYHRYLKLKEELDVQCKDMEEKIKRLKNRGMEDKAIRDTYPFFDQMRCFLIDIEDLTNLTLKKSKCIITKEQLKRDLLDAIDDCENGLESIVGREDIKNQIAQQIYVLAYTGEQFFKSFNNIIIFGPSGSGKTKLAQVLAFVFSKIGILAKNIIKIVTRADLIGQYIGHTAPRTRSVLIETLEGILFIDEAYQLVATGSHNDFGYECITEIVNFLDKYIGLSIVIVAGYEEQMKKNFLQSNEGLPRRFPFRYSLKKYTEKELTNILITNMNDKISSEIEIDEQIEFLLFSVIIELEKNPYILQNQAGDMLNLSSSIIKVIYCHYSKWKNGNFKVNSKIILLGVSDFLYSKGYHIDAFKITF